MVKSITAAVALAGAMMFAGAMEAQATCPGHRAASGPAYTANYGPRPMARPMMRQPMAPQYAASYGNNCGCPVRCTTQFCTNYNTQYRDCLPRYIAGQCMMSSPCNTGCW